MPAPETDRRTGVITDVASLKMAFDAKAEPLLRALLHKPLRPPFVASPQLAAVYQRAYELALRRAIGFDEADDASLVPTPPEFDELPYAEAWSKDKSRGDAVGRMMRSCLLEELGAAPGAVAPPS